MTEITSCTLTYGATVVTLSAAKITPKKEKIIARGTVPFRSGDVVQLIGHKTKEITIEATLYGANKDTDKANLEAFRDGDYVVSYNDSETGTVDVLVEDADFPHVGGTEPSFYKGTIKLVVA